MPLFDGLSNVWFVFCALVTSRIARRSIIFNGIRKDVDKNFFSSFFLFFSFQKLLLQEALWYTEGMADDDKIESIEDVDEKDLLHRISEAEKQYAELKLRAGDAYAALGISPEDAQDVLQGVPLEEYKKLLSRAKEIEKELFKGPKKTIRHQLLAKRKKKKRKKKRSRMPGARKGWLDAR